MEPTDGMRLMEGLHERQPRLPVLIMTAHATIQTAVEAVRRGAFDYLTKPFVRDELRSKIARTLATRRWARDRERLLTVGQALASSGVMARVLDSVAQATVEATDADRCVVFQLEQGRLVPMASAGSPPPAWTRLEAAASAAMDKGVPITTSGVADGGDGGTIVAAPLVVQRGPAGALVIETAARLEPGEDDLELLALFSSQAAIAIRNTHDLESLKSGAVAALGRMATQVAHEVKNPLAGLRLYVRHLEQHLAKVGRRLGPRSRRQDRRHGRPPDERRRRDHRVRPAAGAAPRADGAAPAPRRMPRARPRAPADRRASRSSRPTIRRARQRAWIRAS